MDMMHFGPCPPFPSIPACLRKGSTLLKLVIFTATCHTLPGCALNYERLLKPSANFSGVKSLMLQHTGIAALRYICEGDFSWGTRRISDLVFLFYSLLLARWQFGACECIFFSACNKNIYCAIQCTSLVFFFSISYFWVVNMSLSWQKGWLLTSRCLNERHVNWSGPPEHKIGISGLLYVKLYEWGCVFFLALYHRVNSALKQLCCNVIKTTIVVDIISRYAPGVGHFRTLPSSLMPDVCTADSHKAFAKLSASFKQLSWSFWSDLQLKFDRPRS